MLTLGTYENNVMSMKTLEPVYLGLVGMRNI